MFAHRLRRILPAVVVAAGGFIVSGGSYINTKCAAPVNSTARPCHVGPPPDNRACRLQSDADLKELSTGRAVVLVCRGHRKADQDTARRNLAAALDSLRRKHADAAKTMLFYVIDDDSERSLADLLLTRLGIYHDKPFIIM